MLFTAENLTNYTSTLSMASGRNKVLRERSLSSPLSVYACVCVSISLCIYKYWAHGRAFNVYASRPMKPFGGGGRGVLAACLNQFSLSILDVLPPVTVVAVGVDVGVGVSVLRL